MPPNSNDFSAVVPIFLKGARGRADLLLALALAQDNAVREQALAAVLDFFPVPEEQLDEELICPIPISEEIEVEAIIKDPSHHRDLFRPYRLVAVETLGSKETWLTKAQELSESGKLTHADMDAWDDLRPLPKAQPIVPWTRLWPRLRKAVACRHAAGIDYKRLSDWIARGIAIRQLPRLNRLAWPSPLTVILDFSDRLAPYRDDWHWLRKHLQKSLHHQARCYRLDGVPHKALQPLSNGKPGARFVDWPNLNAGSTVLLVSDLGMVDPAHPWPGACWQGKLNDYRNQGVRVLVLAPVSARHLQPSLVNAAPTVRLSPDSTLRPVSRMPAVTEASFLPEQADSAACKTLLAMLSVATRAEPALLRELRRCLAHDGRDAGVEGEVWCHPHLDTSAIACAVSPHAVNKWRDEFQKLDNGLKQRVLACLRDWHARLPQAIHHEETLVWHSLAQSRVDANEASHIGKARSFFERLTHSLQETDSILLSPAALALQIQFADRHLQWAAPVLARSEAYITQLSVAMHRVDADGTRDLPEGVDPLAWLQAWPVQPEQKLKLIQQADLHLHLIADIRPETAELGESPLADMELDRSVVLWTWDEDGTSLNYRPWHWQTPLPEDTPQLPALLGLPGESLQSASTSLCILTGRWQLRFKRIALPSWAAGIGQDQYGLYTDLELSGLSQRFRWINPGIFLMGSPDNEPERLGYEQLHSVTLSQGYWLADSACTQALWLAVMGNNPSRFQDDPNNPVESVTWNDVQAFTRRLNQRLPGLAARLPTEAEWEYACRAGTTTPFSFGENITTAEVNYNGDFPYTGAAKGEYREKTVPVKSLPANLWGLYEMHGNVWEWCQDWYGDYPQDAVIDPPGPTKGFLRVLRGGSWNSSARYARSANRLRYHPGGRYDFGFRLALGRSGVSQEGQEGRSKTPGRTVAAERDGQAGRLAPPGRNKSRKK